MGTQSITNENVLDERIRRLKIKNNNEKNNINTEKEEQIIDNHQRRNQRQRLLPQEGYKYNNNKNKSAIIPQLHKPKNIVKQRDLDSMLTDAKISDLSSVGVDNSPRNKSNLVAVKMSEPQPN